MEHAINKKEISKYFLLTYFNYTEAKEINIMN